MTNAMHALVLTTLCCGAGPNATVNDTHHLFDEARASDLQLAAQLGWHRLQGFRWQMLLIDPETDKGQSVDPGKMFRTGEEFRLSIETFSDLFLYVVTVDDNNRAEMLLPDAERGETEFVARRFRPAVLPPEKGVFTFRGKAGSEHFRIIASPHKLRWSNPAELLELESGDPPVLPRRGRDAALRQRPEVVSKSLVKTIEEIGDNASLRKRVYAKATTLLPPPDDGGQEVILALPETGEQGVTVAKAVLRHRP